MQELLKERADKRVSLHGRTRVQMYEGTANWDIIKEVNDHLHTREEISNVLYNYVEEVEAREAEKVSAC
ncbi:tRNA-dihydrouridine synthase [Thalassorhabdus alkalitolerans]|uniref:tRNA-dihydrouridine synthase n=1 Tax=Thalassorhabdus alkalitolerans TaxID=2282697 RepID=A0ABW0YRT1_9BACI